MPSNKDNDTFMRVCKALRAVTDGSRQSGRTKWIKVLKREDPDRSVRTRDMMRINLALHRHSIKETTLFSALDGVLASKTSPIGAAASSSREAESLRCNQAIIYESDMMRYIISHHGSISRAREKLNTYRVERGQSVVQPTSLYSKLAGPSDTVRLSRKDAMRLLSQDHTSVRQMLYEAAMLNQHKDDSSLAKRLGKLPTLSEIQTDGMDEYTAIWTVIENNEQLTVLENYMRDQLGLDLGQAVEAESSSLEGTMPETSVAL